MIRTFNPNIPVTILFIAFSIGISVITWFGAIHSTLSWFIYDQQLIFSGQIWRLITPIFLHFPTLGIIFAHLAFNMIWLYQFGNLIEQTDSSHFLLILIIVSGILSNIAQDWMSSYGIFGGMSGVVYALLGYLFIIKKLNPRYPAGIQDNIAYFLIGFMLISAIGLLGDGIADTAHITGFIIGILFACWRARKSYSAY